MKKERRRDWLSFFGVLCVPVSALVVKKTEEHKNSKIHQLHQMKKRKNFIHDPDSYRDELHE
jgi:hypothetical protein